MLLQFITTEYITHIFCIQEHLFCNSLIHVIYSGASSKCSHTISCGFLGCLDTELGNRM